MHRPRQNAALLEEEPSRNEAAKTLKSGEQNKRLVTSSVQKPRLVYIGSG